MFEVEDSICFLSDCVICNGYKKEKTVIEISDVRFAAVSDCMSDRKRKYVDRDPGRRGSWRCIHYNQQDNGRIIRLWRQYIDSDYGKFPWILESDLCSDGCFFTGSCYVSIPAHQQKV